MLPQLRNKLGLISFWLLLITLVVNLALVKETKGERKIDFWKVQRKGANFFNQVPTYEWLEAASKLGLQFIRLAPDKWESADRDFLIGNADNYVSINEQDLAKLLKVLDEANALNLKVVITMLSLPGVRWK
jgi:endoglucanase